MEDKELERILQEKAENTKMRDFSEVWKEIEPEIKGQKQEKKPFWTKKFSLILASAFIAICVALAPILINVLKPTPEELYFADELDKQSVSSEEMLNKLSETSFAFVDISEYIITDSYLFVTEELEIKGATLNFCDNADNTTFVAFMQMCDAKVDFNVDIKEYENSIKVNLADVNYKLKQVKDGLYDYSVYATCNGVQYLIEYTGLSDNLLQFLNEFFG